MYLDHLNRSVFRGIKHALIETHRKPLRNISEFVKGYFASSKLRLKDRHQTYAPHKMSRRCDEDLHLWLKDKKNSFRFGIPTAENKTKFRELAEGLNSRVGRSNIDKGIVSKNGEETKNKN